MTNKQMKTLTIGEVIYEVVDEQARTDIDNLKSSTMILDTSLSQSGKAADAKAVGDAINEINETINSFGTYIGDGSQLVRTVEVGGNGNAIIIFSETVKFAIVTAFGSYYVDNNGTAEVQDTTSAVFSSGSISFGGDNNVFNSDGIEYKYIVL